MHVAVDQPRGQRRALGVNSGVRTAGVKIGKPAHGIDLAIDHDNRIRFQDRRFQRTRKHDAYILNDQLVRHDILPEYSKVVCTLMITLDAGTRKWGRSEFLRTEMIG